MNNPTITAAHITLLEDGTPYAADYGDVYHSADGALAQARAVFITGCGLPQRWADRRIFRVLETGFGLGINTLATASAWLADPAHGERLHLFSIEKHPASAEDLARSHGHHPELASLSRELIAQWPLPLPGLHRLWLAEDRVLLTLCFGDIESLLPKLDGPFDAFYLDGFSPARNPAMWSENVFGECARLAAAGATLATWSAAGAVREGLTRAGFAVERQPGFGRKKHRLQAVYRPPAWRTMAADPATTAPAAREVLIIGGGIAGAAVAQQFARRGWTSTLIDAADTLPGGASAIRAATLHPHLSPDDALLSRLLRSGFLHTAAAWRMLTDAGHDPEAHCTGLAVVAEDEAEAANMAETVARLALPPQYACSLDAATLSTRCGLPLRHGGWWFAVGGWVEPRALIAAQLEYAGTRLIRGQHVAGIRRSAGQWQALDTTGQVIASAAALVLANAADAARLAPAEFTLRMNHGQQTLLSAPGTWRPAVPLTGAVNAFTLDDGRLLLGGHYASGAAASIAEAHRDNLQRWQRVTGHALPQDDLHAVTGSRVSTPDHLPLAGAMPDTAAAIARAEELRGAQLQDLPRQPQLYGAFGYGSRGLAWSVPAAELIACMANGEPPPLERELAAALDPARQLLQALRRGKVDAPG